jgi:membrane protein implicated in regulation of membrane protease activity
MDAALIWAIAGLALVIVELLTGTFYLLMLGVAAFGAAGTAWLGYDFPVQVIVAAVIAAVGCYAAHAYREKNKASFERWIDPGARLARVRYRGASWDARVEGGEALEPGTTVYVLAADGNTLKVVKNRPA